MFQKFIFTLVLILTTCLCAAPASMAQSNDYDAMLETVFADEPPLTQVDIDNFIKIGPDMVQAANANSIANAAKTLQQVDWTEKRGSYVTAKICNAYAIYLSPEMAKSMLENAGMPEFLLPTDSEMALVQKNIEALDKIFLSIDSF